MMLEEIAEEMHFLLVVRHAQFHAGDNFDAVGDSCRERVINSLHGIVVGQRYRVQSHLRRESHQLCRRQHAVGKRRMNVEVNTRSAGMTPSTSPLVARTAQE